MDKNCEAFTNPVYSANEKITALRALARKANLPDEDLPLLAIIIAQSMEVVQRDFISVVGPLMYAPEPVLKNMLVLLAPLRHVNDKLKQNPELLDIVITAYSEAMEENRRVREG